MGIVERRRREKDLRRELAMNAAMAIYNEEGYHSITIDKIADRCELSRASIYMYFKNKDDILIRGIVSHTEYFFCLLMELYENRESFKEKLLQELWTRFIRFYEKESEIFNVYTYFLQREMILNLPEDIRDMISKSGSRVVELQHNIVKYGIQEGIFIDCNPMILSEVIWTSFLGIVNLERSKQILSHRNYFRSTSALALKVLQRGILK